MSTTIHDSSEPWRYCCPHCRSHSLRTRVGGNTPRCKDYEAEWPMANKPGQESVADYYCDHCQTPVEDPHDKKGGCHCEACAAPSSRQPSEEKT